MKINLKNIPSACVCLKLRKASRSVTQRYDEALAPCNIRISQFGLLIALSETGPVCIGALAEKLAIDRTTLSRTMEPLIKSGLALSCQGIDRRNKLLDITRKGQKTLNRAVPLWEQAQSSTLARLDDKKWDQLSAGLIAISASVSE